MEDQCCQFQVRVGDGAAVIGEFDQFQDDVGRPLYSPDKVCAVFVWLNPDP